MASATNVAMCNLDDLDPACLAEVLGASGEPATMLVCMRWTAALEDPRCLARLLLARGGHNSALYIANKAGRTSVVRCLLGLVAYEPWLCENALFDAATAGHLDTMRLLLEWPGGYAPRADCDDGLALCKAAEAGHVDAMRLLLEWPGGYAPRADCGNGAALVRAAMRGRVDAMRLLLEWPGGQAPRADCHDGKALRFAAFGGHVDAVRLLLEWLDEPARDYVEQVIHHELTNKVIADMLHAWLVAAS